jgi:transcriptional regulator with PAS, ATPase and Fis domain
MINLSVINDFIQAVSLIVADTLSIETSVVDRNLIRIAGTVRPQVPKVIVRGIITTVLETGQYCLVPDTKTDPQCSTCSMLKNCRETACVHCPIVYKGEIVGIMGLMCMDDEQRRRLVIKPKTILKFLQQMCDIISLKLNEYENHQKEKEMYSIIESYSAQIDLILNSISDGYLIVDNQNNITRINRSAKAILNIIKAGSYSELLSRILNEFDKHGYEDNISFYDEFLIGQKYYGITINPMFSDNTPIGKILNFKTIDKIGYRTMRKASNPITLNEILGESPGIVRMKEMVRKSAENDLSVLLSGESGTGKELIAQAVHNMSRRRGNPFIALNCAAIPENLLESELFGFEQGAFTGAMKGGKPGKFECAHQGTLFLDEIGDMPLFLQAKLLRVLQDFSIERIGSTKSRHVDIRIIAATNQNLDTMLTNGTFRRDLFYRLNVIPIAIPPLRERGDDVILLARHFLQKYSQAAGCLPKQLSGEAFEVLRAYPWPGNVRELENLIQYLVFIQSEEVIGISDLPFKYLSQNKNREFSDGQDPGQAMPITKLENIEREMILKTVTLFGNTTEGKFKAAKALGISKTTLYRKLAEMKNL